jgi:lipopolysaccharide transport system ATP-binding protein
VLLDRGELLAEGAPKFVVSRYHKMLYVPADRLEAVREAIRTERDGDSQADQEYAPEFSVVDRQDAEMVASSTEQATIRTDSDSRGWFDEGMVPKSTVRYDSRGASIAMPHIETLAGRMVNVLHAGDEYVYAYRVTFQEAMASVRFGMLIKTLAGLELGGAASSLPADSIPLVDAGGVVEVRFRFRCLLDSGTYFLNAGVLARVAEEETYVDRLIDAAMFRVMPQPERLATGFVDFCIGTEMALMHSSKEHA